MNREVVGFLESAVKEKCIKGQIYSVYMKSLYANMKCPSCKAIANDKVDDKLLICDECGVISTDWVSAAIASLTMKDFSTNGKINLAVDIAILNNKVELVEPN